MVKEAESLPSLLLFSEDITVTRICHWREEVLHHWTSFGLLYAVSVASGNITFGRELHFLVMRCKSFIVDTPTVYC